jgi:hypothetical protein
MNTKFYTYYSDCCNEVVSAQDTDPYCSECGESCRALTTEEYEAEQQEEEQERLINLADHLRDEQKEGNI